MGYNTETTQVRILNQSFVDKLDNGMVKEASASMAALVRQKLREDSFARQILNATMITPNELDRQVGEDPVFIAEKELDSVAVTLPFTSRAPLRYFNSSRYPVTFTRMTSSDFRKNKFELLTSRTDIVTLLQENSVKDLQRQEDEAFINNVTNVMAANGKQYSVTGGVTIPNVVAGIKYLLQNQVPAGCMLMTQSMYMDILKQPATQLGSPLASAMTAGEKSLDNFFGFKPIVTNKNDLLPDNRIMFFTAPQYLGQFFVLQDSTVFLKTEADMIQFLVYESVGMGIGNINGAVSVDF